MSFVRAKEIPPRSGNWYDYLVETTHNKGKVQQKVIQYLGKSGHSAISTGLRSLHLQPQFTKSNDGSISVKQSAPKVACKICNGQHTRKYGMYKGVTQYYYCDDCHKKFTGTDALPNGKVSPNFIVNALNEYYSGMSYHDIADNIEDQTKDNISHVSIIKWINKYTDDAIQKTKHLKPQVGDTWIADETFIRIDKSKARVDNPYDKSRSAKWIVFWDIIDADTRFLLASHVATTRSKEDARILMEKAAQKAGKTPKVVVTDNLRAYIDGIELAYGSDTSHKQGGPFEIKNNTNLIERFHGTLKDRTKVMRALKNKQTLQKFTDGWLTYYNFFKKHMGIENRTPAEEAGIKYDVKSWADVVGIDSTPIVQTLEPQKVS